MASSIADPFLLAIYAAQKQKACRNIHPTWENTAADGHVTVAANGDGIHVIDLSSLHPVVSHTLGPSTTFSGPSSSRTTRTEDVSVCTTYAVIEASSDSLPDASGREVWIWREKTTGALEKSSQKKKQLPHAIAQLHLPEELPSRVLLVSQKGELSLTDEDLAIQNTHSTEAPIIKSFFFARESCTFVPTRKSLPRGTVAVLFSSAASAMSVHVVAVNEDEGFVILGTVSVSLDHSDIASISCSTSGFISILTRKKQSLHTFQLESTDGTTLSLTTPTEPMHLTNLTSYETSTLSLGASHVLLAGVTKASEIALLLWDLQFSVLLASQTLPIPSTLSRVNQNLAPISVELFPAAPTQALLVLSPAPSVTGRSSVLVVPYIVPATSTIANAMGKAAAGAKWIASEQLQVERLKAPEAAREKVLGTMAAAITQNRPEAASDAFFEWDKAETVKLRVKEVQGGPNGTAKPQAVFTYDHTFVKRVLEIVFQPSNSANIPYSSKVIHHLIEKNAVSGGMVEGGLLCALRLRNDWDSVLLALENVLSISEDEIITTLQIVVCHHRTRTNTNTDAMQVDSTSAIPTLSTFLAASVSYTTSPAALRLAVRQHLSEAEDIMPVLEVIDGWVDAWARKDVQLLPLKKNVAKNERGVTIVKAGKAGKKDLPSLAKILTFLQTTLDASFLALLQHTPAHGVLQKLSAQLEPELALIEQLEAIRGPLEPFAKAQTKAIREGSEGGKREPVVDWRKRKKEAHAQTGIAVGLYRLEELVI